MRALASATERALGRLLSKHRTDNRRRGRAALRALVPGALAVGASAVALAAGLPGYAAGLLLAAGLVGAVRGTLLAVDHRRLGGEVFAVRERGAVHRRGGRVTAIPWRDIAAVRINDRARALRWLSGRDVVARVVLGGGRSLAITGFTHDALSLAHELAARADAGADADTRADASADAVPRRS
ncbi:hypothetical protein DEH69_10680 [Streptomyces sp. PT12]|nr:hypothetical protein DEH69_10680 [Streptomyces sp. PT12]